MIEYLCQDCGSVFHVQAAGKSTRRYCNRKCAAAAAKKRFARQAKAVVAAGVKVCLHCKCELPLKFFYRCSSLKTERGGSCKGCIYVQRYQGSFPERGGRGRGLVIPGGLPAFADRRSAVMREFVKKYWASIFNKHPERTRKQRQALKEKARTQAPPAAITAGLFSNPPVPRPPTAPDAPWDWGF